MTRVGLLAGITGKGVGSDAQEGVYSLTATPDVALAAATPWWRDVGGVAFNTAGRWVGNSTEGLRANVSVPEGATVMDARPTAPTAWTTLHAAMGRDYVGVLATDAQGDPVAFDSCPVQDLEAADPAWSPLVQVFIFGAMVAQGMGHDLDGHVPADGFILPGYFIDWLSDRARWREGFDVELIELPALWLKDLGVASSRVSRQSP